MWPSSTRLSTAPIRLHRERSGGAAKFFQRALGDQRASLVERQSSGISDLRGTMANTPKVTLNLRYSLKPGAREAMLAELKTILDLCAQEPEFISAILQEAPERPDEILVFELWHGTREDFARVQGPKQYRRDYIERSKLLYESVQATFSTPVAEWRTTLLAHGVEQH